MLVKQKIRMIIDFKEELFKITKILLKNQYPEKLIRTRMNYFRETNKKKFNF